MEHIVSLRLIIDTCLRKKWPLYIVYVDFTKAYDKIPRRSILQVLKDMGCGAVMLKALASFYKVSKSLIGLTIVSAVVGVCQGSPTSCLIFVIYVNILIRWFKRNNGLDGYLKWLHCLMLMDDTVILATSRANCVRKLQTLLDYCKEYNMEINEKKTKNMCVGKMNLDTDTLVVTSSDGNVTYRIDHCESYVYLGCVFTSDGSTKTALNKHVEDKRKHLLKLIMFYVKNQEMPFHVKLKVLNACFLSSVLYSWESWINVSLKPVEKLYYGAI